MSVLDTMRRSTDSTTMRVLFGIMVLFFIFWGIKRKTANTGGQEDSTEATINGTRITGSELNTAVRLGRKDDAGDFSEEAEKRLRVKTLDQMIQEEMLVQEADRLNIEISDDELARAVLQMNQFKGEDGKFNEELYDKSLKNMGLSQGKWEDMIRRDMQIEKLVGIVSSAVQVPEADVKHAYAQDNTTVDLAWIKVPEAALLDDVPVKDSEIDDFLTKDAVDQKAKKQYDADHDRLYNTPRKAQISAILLRNDIPGNDPDSVRSKMTAIQKQAAAADNAGFVELARIWSEDLTAANGGDMGLLPEPLMDPTLARAVFEVGAGKTTDIVETGRGLWVARVVQVIDAKETPFEDVKRNIARELIAKDRVGALTQDYANKILTAWKLGAAPPQDLLAAQDLKVKDTGSEQLSRLSVPELGDATALMAAVQSATGPGVLPTIYPTAGGWVVASLTSWSGADMSQYEAGRDPVYQRVMMAERNRFVEAWLTDLKKHTKIVNNEEDQAPAGT